MEFFEVEPAIVDCFVTDGLRQIVAENILSQHADDNW